MLLRSCCIWDKTLETASYLHSLFEICQAGVMKFCLANRWNEFSYRAVALGT